jgi:aryl-alcohol dehydrogenase-like predicted oxidoreductase
MEAERSKDNMGVWGNKEHGLTSSAIGLGCGAFSGGYGLVDEGESIRTIQHALDIGITMIDIADFYGAGDVERTVGRAITGRRHEALIATRGGIRFNSDGKPIGVDGSPDYLSRACDASLRRLAVDRIDLYYLASVDSLVSVEESIGRLTELVAAGKIDRIGLSKASAEQLRRAHAIHPLAAVASEYSLLERTVEAEVLPTARELGIELFACRPLARGLLTGRISSVDHLEADDFRRGDRRFWRENVARRRGMLLAAERMAAEKDVSLGRLALAWLLTQPGVVPVPSTRNRLHLEMNAAAVDVPLSSAERDQIAALFPLRSKVADS